MTPEKLKRMLCCLLLPQVYLVQLKKSVPARCQVAHEGVASLRIQAQALPSESSF